jgi:hypothetical protein
MSGLMSVIYVPETGHALAAVTRTADPTVPFDLSHLGGGQLIVTNINSITSPSTPGEEGETFFVPSSVLKVTKNPISPIAALLSNPLDYAVDNDVPQAIGPSTVQMPTLTATQIQIGIASPPAGSLNVWVHVQEKPPLLDPANPEVRVSSGQMPAGSGSVTITLTGSPGGVPIALPTGKNYSILLLVAGYQAFFWSQLVT